MLESRRYRRDRSELPATLRRSCQEAQDTFTTHDNAVQAYGEGDQADVPHSQPWRNPGNAAITGSPSAIPQADKDRSAGPAGPGIGKIRA